MHDVSRYRQNNATLSFQELHLVKRLFGSHDTVVTCEIRTQLESATVAVVFVSVERFGLRAVSRGFSWKTLENEAVAPGPSKGAGGPGQQGAVDEEPPSREHGRSAVASMRATLQSRSDAKAEKLDDLKPREFYLLTML